jgi:hypothetical protein
MKFTASVRVPWRIAWVLGLVSKRSCYRADGTPKIRYGSEGSAAMAAHHMGRKTGKNYDVYRCWFHCRKWHIGRSVRS